MEKQHLTYFKVENFKRFDSFEMSNLGQFNLIVGDNNVGKTSVLEALCLGEDRVSMLSFLALSFLHRNKILKKWDVVYNDLIYQRNFWSNVILDIAIPLSIWQTTENSKKNTSIEFVNREKLTKEDIEFINTQLSTSKQPEIWIKYYENGIFKGVFGSYGEEVKKFVHNDITYSSKILRMNSEYNVTHNKFYYNLINPSKDKRAIFDECLRLIVKNLDEVRPHKVFDTELLGLVLKDDKNIYPVTQFGDGLIKLIRIILGIILCDSKRIMIDEVDAGIHFSRLKDYWKTIIRLCAKYNVQLFATTHSLECQRAFVDAVEDSELQPYQKDARNISLIENKDGEVKAINYDFEQFENALNIGFNTRGGVL